MGKDSDYIDFWLTTSHDSHGSSGYSSGGNAPNPKLFESKNKLKLHYFIGGSAILLSLTGCILAMLPMFVIPLYAWPLGDMVLFFACHAIGVLSSYIMMYKIESNIKDHVKFDRYRLSEQVYTCKTAVRFWKNVSLILFLLSIAPSIITFILWDQPKYLSIYDEPTFWEWWAAVNHETIPISMSFAIVSPITNLLLTAYYAGVNMDVDELISENKTFIKAYQSVNSVNIEILSELFKSDAKLYFTNGCYLTVLNEPHKNKHGYILYDKQGNKQEFIFEEQASSFADLLMKGYKIYEKIIDNINKALIKKNIEDITDKYNLKTKHS